MRSVFLPTARFLRSYYNTNMLAQPSFDSNIIDALLQAAPRSPLYNPLTLEKFQLYIRALASYHAAGSDGLPINLFKIFSPPVLNALHDLLCQA